MKIVIEISQGVYDSVLDKKKWSPLILDELKDAFSKGMRLREICDCCIYRQRERVSK